MPWESVHYPPSEPSLESLLVSASRMDVPVIVHSPLYFCGPAFPQLLSPLSPAGNADWPALLFGNEARLVMIMPLRQ